MIYEKSSSTFSSYGKLTFCLLILSSIKEIVYPKIKLFWKCTHSQAFQDVDEFASSSEQIWRNVALHHLLSNRSSAVNGCRQNESPNSW